MKVKNNVFYRLYDDECYVWDLNNQKEYIFSNSVFYILNTIKDNNSMTLNALVEEIEKLFSSVENRNLIIDFIDQLQDLNLVEDLNGKIVTIDDKIDSKIFNNNILFSALFELTYRCNEKCIHCYAENNSSRKELSTEEVKAVIDNLYKANVAEITFSGGEIFIRNDASNIIEYAYEKGFLINVFSNGINVNADIILKLAKCHIKSFQTSIYGSYAPLHDSITGVKGSFDKTISVLKEMTDLGITTCMKTTIMKDNVHDYHNIKMLADSLGCGLEVGLNIIPTLSKNKKNSLLRIGEEDLLKIKKDELKRDISEDEIQNQDDSLAICNAGHTNITINPYGDIVLCTGFDTVIGNAVIDDISILWMNSEVLNEWRALNRRSLECRKKCDCKDYCSFCPAQAYLETGNPLSRYREACIHAKLEKKAKEDMNNESKKRNTGK